VKRILVNSKTSFAKHARMFSNYRDNQFPILFRSKESLISKAQIRHLLVTKRNTKQQPSMAAIKKLTVRNEHTSHFTTEALNRPAM